MNFEMYIGTRILFGQGQLDKLHERKMPGKKALVVISNGKSVKENGTLDKTLTQLEKAGVTYHIFNGINANPTDDSVMQGASVAKENDCDFIVAIGGGSVMDASKAIAAMATNDGDIWDYMFGGTGKQQTLKNDPLPIIAITTTAGTGSEVDRWGVVSNLKTNEKIGFGGYDSLFPVYAVVDPEVMKSVPPTFTAYQGFDALFHSVECYISKAANLMSDMYALKAIESIAKYLSRAVNDGNDMEAREHVAFANTLSGVVMELSCCTSEHSMEHAMSAYHPELPHGAGLIMISKAYFSYFVNQHVRDERFIEMAKVMGKTDANNPMDFIDALVELQTACGVSELKMSEYGFKVEEFDEMAKNARETMGGLFMADPCVLTHDACVAIYKESYR